jgi:hypothetical protein
MSRSQGLADKVLAGAIVLIIILTILGTLPPAVVRGSRVVAAEVRFAVIGDSGTGQKPQYEIGRQMDLLYQKEGFGFVLMLGDNIYPNGNPKLFKRRFEEPYKALLDDGVKFYASLGNHDVIKGGPGELEYPDFNMRGRSYYSFVEGDGLAQFFALDSTHIDAGQLGWLEEELRKSAARWKIAFFHHPLYSTCLKHGSSLHLRACLEPLFVKYGMNVVFSGHDHVYERLKPSQGVYYFVTGAAGQLRKGNINREDPSFEAGNDSVNSFVYAAVGRDSFVVNAIGLNGEKLDEVSIPAGSRLER